MSSCYGKKLFLRIKQICSDDEDFFSHVVIKALHMKRRGYPIDLLTTAFKSVCLNGRAPLLKRRNTTNAVKEKKNRDDKIVAITTYHPSCRLFSRTLRMNWDLFGSSATPDSLFSKRVVVAQRRPPNIGDSLIRAKLPSEILPTPTPSINLKRKVQNKAVQVLDTPPMDGIS